MTRRILFGSWMCVVAACGGAPPPAANRAPIEQGRAAELASDGLRAAEGATRMDAACGPEVTVDVCDGVDGDCDHRIDEGCPGVEPARLEVALAWNSPAHIELEVRAPGGERIETRGIDGCANAEAPRLERASFATPTEGTYTIAVVHRDACGVDGPVTVSASIATGDQGAIFNRTIEAGGTAEIATARFVAR